MSHCISLGWGKHHIIANRLGVIVSPELLNLWQVKSSTAHALFGSRFIFVPFQQNKKHFLTLSLPYSQTSAYIMLLKWRLVHKLCQILYVSRDCSYEIETDELSVGRGGHSFWVKSSTVKQASTRVNYTRAGREKLNICSSVTARWTGVGTLQNEIRPMWLFCVIFICCQPWNY